MINKSPIKQNIVANMVGNGWSVFLSIAFIPFYIRFLGIEAYGLIGFFVTLQSLSAILDMGLTATASRELARLSIIPNSEVRAQNLVRTLETIYWALAIIIAVIFILIAPWVATKWLEGNELSIDTIHQSVIFMGIVVAIRMPFGFYCGGLLGLQRQVLLNGIKIVIDGLRSGGVVLILWLVAPTINAFFIWQILISILGVIIIFFVLWNNLPKTRQKPVFQPSILLQTWRFMAGMSSIAVLSVILVQADKVILSNLITLDEFAFYSLASMVALGLNVIIVPIYSAVYPRFTQLVTNQDNASLKLIYHKSCQFMTVLVMPITFVVCIFSEPLLHLWTQDVIVSTQSAPLLSILIIGTSFNAMMNIPYAIQLANGCTKLSIYADLIAIVIIVPLLLIMVSKYNVIGAAIAWVIINAGFVIFVLPIIHMKFMAGELKKWFIFDFAKPTIISLCTVSVFWYLTPPSLNSIGKLFWIVLTLLCSFFLSAILTPATRKFFLDTVCRNNNLSI